MTWSLDEPAFAAWLERYKQAWEQRDPAAASALFTDQATYRETPYDPPFEGKGEIHDYWAKAVAGQRDVSFSYDPLACTGDRGICRWHCSFTTEPGGDRIDLDGIFVCRFAEATLVDGFEEWWHLKVTPAA